MCDAANAVVCAFVPSPKFHDHVAPVADELMANVSGTPVVAVDETLIITLGSGGGTGVGLGDGVGVGLAETGG